MFIQWEPGFDGGFQQRFETRIKDVTTGKSRTVGSEHTPLTPDTRYVFQDIIIDPDIKYAFSVKSVNVQGSSDFSSEKIKELKGIINSIGIA